MLPEGGAQSPESFRALLEKRAPLFGLKLSDGILDRLAQYLGLLDLARRQTNLTGPLSSEDLVDHVLESALGERLISHGARVVDIGSGAGFPGVPLAIVRPDIAVTPVEPRNKRVEFLTRVSRELPVTNLSLPVRDLGLLPENAVDVATARAVGGVERLIGKGRFLVPGGLFLAWITDLDETSRRLAPLFELETDIPVPESRHKRIVGFRRRHVPRGTADQGPDKG